MMYNKLFLGFLIFIQLASCQGKRETGFVLEKKKLYYNSKEIELGMPVEKFTDAMGMFDRIVIDSSGGKIIKNYYWKTKLIKLNKHSDNDYYIITKFKKNAATGQIVEDTESYDKIENLEDIISKYGKYDSIEEIKSPLRIEKLFIWDELGVSLSAYPETNIVGNIFIQTLHLTKSRELDLGLVKNLEEERGLPLTEETKEKRKNDKWFFNRRPKKEYAGNFTFNGKTINLKKAGYTGWEKAIKGLGIVGSDYYPPGDSPQWSRWIRVHSDMYITFERFSNMDEYNWGEPSKENMGQIDCMQSIVIWWYKTD
ncbi:DUF7738 domain-containing protein [Flavobacterium ajazii]|uniref:DUF7738 domain-containing protein n=1 Tax=Flavobacterium ajazii TaxID=2692318 RepID=UPI0013D6B37C|nr:hypothetical protein [Flavobacterium ajazii]